MSSSAKIHHTEVLLARTGHEIGNDEEEEKQTDEKLLAQLAKEDEDKYETGSDSDDSYAREHANDPRTAQHEVDERLAVKLKKKQQKKEAAEEKAKGIPGGLKQKFGKHRAEMKERIIKQVMDEMMADIGAYDVDEEPPQREEKWYDVFFGCFRFFGCMNMDLHDAVLSGSERSLDNTLEEVHGGKKSNRAKINVLNKQGCTPLSMAVKAGQAGMVFSILNRKIDPDVPDLETGRTPLYYAALNGREDICKLLVDAGAKCDFGDFHAVTPLMLASSRELAKTLSYMINKNRPFPDLDAQDDNGWTCLHYAAFGNASQCCRILVDYGADRAIKDKNKRKAIHLAKFNDYGDCESALEDVKSKLVFETQKKR